MSLIKALIHPVTPFQQNAPILYCEEKIAEDIYDKPQWFNIFEVREL